LVVAAAGTPSAAVSPLDPSNLSDVVEMAAKNRRLARNSKLGDDDAITSLGNSYRPARVGLWDALLTIVVSN
jgi:hypothetical protein